MPELLCHVACRAVAGRFSQAHQQLQALLQQRQDLEGAVHAAQQLLHQVSSRMEDVQQQVAERTDQLQGSVLLQRQRSAVGSLRDELQQMELRLGLLAHQLVKCKQQQADRQLWQDQQAKDQLPAVVV
jgi:chromosome segregation ATPase